MPLTPSAGPLAVVRGGVTTFLHQSPINGICYSVILVNDSLARAATEQDMKKPAPTEYDVHELIRERWSPRAFADRPVPAEILCQLLEAARWAASSFNEQPWAYLPSRC